MQFEISAIVNFDLGIEGLVVKMSEFNGPIWNVVKSMFAKVLDKCNAVFAHDLKSLVNLFVDLGLYEKRAASEIENSFAFFLIWIWIKHSEITITDGNISKHSRCRVF